MGSREAVMGIPLPLTGILEFDPSPPVLVLPFTPVFIDTDGNGAAEVFEDDEIEGLLIVVGSLETVAGILDGPA